MQDRWIGTRAVCAAAAAVVLVVGAQPARAEQHKDEKLGYQFTYPKGWLKRPVNPDERWVVAKFECDREYEQTDKSTGMFDRHRPWIDVVVLPYELEKQKKSATVERGPGGISIREGIRWTNLKEYLEVRLPEVEPGGFYFSKEEQGTVGTFTVQQFEITVEKLVPIPKRVYGWAFPTEDCWYCFIGQVPIPQEDKLKNDVLAAFRSFKAFPRKGVLPNAATTGESVTVLDDPSTKTDEQREKDRNAAFERRLTRVKESVGKDWIQRDSENFTAISHCDSKYTGSVLDHLEAVRAWLEKNLGFLGSGKPGKVLVRLCADQEEYRALVATGGWYSPEQVEIVTYRDKESANWTFERLGQRYFQLWLRDKDRDIYWKIPRWLDEGLEQLMGMAATKAGRKLEFRPDEWDRGWLAEAVRGGSMISAREYFTMTSEDLWKRNAYQQAPFFVQYLMLGGGAKNPKFKEVFRAYVVEMTLLVEEDRKKDAAAPDEADTKVPQNEEEEEQMLAARRNDWRNNEKAFLDKLASKVFAGWSESDWDRMNKSYLAEVK